MDPIKMASIYGEKFSLSIGDDYWFYIDGARVRSISLAEDDTLELIVGDRQFYINAEQFFDFLGVPGTAIAAF
jgi:hypothetical protein